LVKNVAAAAGHLQDVRKPNVIVKHYLDSRHGRHLASHEKDHNYIAHDFKRFKKSYNPKHFDEQVSVTEIADKTKPKKAKDAPVKKEPVEINPMMKESCTIISLEEGKMVIHDSDDNRDSVHTEVKHHGNDGAGNHVYSHLQPNGFHAVSIISPDKKKVVAQSFNKSKEDAHDMANHAVKTRAKHYWDSKNPKEKYYSNHRGTMAVKTIKETVESFVSDTIYGIRESWGKPSKEDHARMLQAALAQQNKDHVSNHRLSPKHTEHFNSEAEKAAEHAKKNKMDPKTAEAHITKHMTTVSDKAMEDHARGGAWVKKGGKYIHANSQTGMVAHMHFGAAAHKAVAHGMEHYGKKLNEDLELGKLQPE
jgi:hypothetical protein